MANAFTTIKGNIKKMKNTTYCIVLARWYWQLECRDVEQKDYPVLVPVLDH